MMNEETAILTNDCARVTVRRAEKGDIPRINELLRQVCLVHHNGRPDLFKYGGRKYTDAQLEMILCDEQRPVLVAADVDGEAVGYAFCMLQRHTGDNILTDMTTLYVDDLCVDERLRGQHIGKTLYESVLELARSLGCYNVTLNVWTCNEPAMRFYESCGLVPQKIGMEKIL